MTSRIAAFRSGLFASRSWLAADGEPADARALLSRPTLVGRADDPLLSSALGSIPSVALAVVTAEDTQLLPLVVAGIGVGMLPVAVAGRHDGLVRVLPDLSAEGAVWMSVHPDLRQVSHVRQVMDAVREMVPGLLS